MYVECICLVNKILIKAEEGLKYLVLVYKRDWSQIAGRWQSVEHQAYHIVAPTDTVLSFPFLSYYLRQLNLGEMCHRGAWVNMYECIRRTIFWLVRWITLPPIFQLSSVRLHRSSMITRADQSENCLGMSRILVLISHTIIVYGIFSTPVKFEFKYEWKVVATSFEFKRKWGTNYAKHDDMVIGLLIPEHT